MGFPIKKFFGLGWIAAVIVVAYVFFSNLAMSFNVIVPGISHVYTSYFMLFSVVLAAVLLVIRLYVVGQVSTFIAICTALTGVSVISTTVNVPWSLLPSSVVAASFWWSIAVIVYVCLEDLSCDLFLLSMMLVFGLVSALYLYLTLSTHSFVLPTPLMASAVYYVLLFLPFVLSCKHRLAKAVSIAVMIFSVLVSEKRTAFVAIVAALIVYYFVTIIVKRKRLSALLLRIAALGAMTMFSIYIYEFVVNTYNLDIIVRLRGMVADEGSGRLHIYQVVIDSVSKFDFPSLIIGKGHNAVYREAGLGMSAHNDFLEILYNYGLLGVSLYTSMIFILLRSNVGLFKKRGESAAIFAASMTLFLAMSMTSHLILYPTYFVVLVAYWCWAGRCYLREGIC